MKDTDQKAQAGKARLVIMILMIGLIFAGAYSIYWTPDEMNSVPIGEVMSD